MYRLPAGAPDGQRPHAEDEIYYVLGGRARFTAGGETIDIQAGSCLFVPGREAHRFHNIIEDLTVLVVFAPPEARATSRSVIPGSTAGS